jgi:hypothetical protein
VGKHAGNVMATPRATCRRRRALPKSRRLGVPGCRVNVDAEILAPFIGVFAVAFGAASQTAPADEDNDDAETEACRKRGRSTPVATQWRVSSDRAGRVNVDA